MRQAGAPSYTRAATSPEFGGKHVSGERGADTCVHGRASSPLTAPA